MFAVVDFGLGVCLVLVKIGSEFLNVIKGFERLIIHNTYGEDVTSQYEEKVLEKLALEGVVNDV